MKYILVIEDNLGDIDLIETVSAMLDREEIIIPVLNGQGALEAIKSYNPKLILMDINLPGTNGIKILREIRKKKYINPVIVLSSSPSPEDILEAYLNGANAYITKPYGMGELIKVLEATYKFWDIARTPSS